MGILPVEPNTKSGNWHRDIFVTHKHDFRKPPFYITQLIYLDDNADTLFCLHSENNPDNNPKKYVIKRIKSHPGSSVVFDGRMLHKGLENNGEKTRYAIYIVCYADSYVDKEAKLETVLD
jgi:ectoine hydroxylase-related dioxygenase (phytanoyl-CoA dioxygenase family)